MKKEPKFEVVRGKGTSWLKISGKDKEGNPFEFLANGYENAARKLKNLFYEVCDSNQDVGVIFNILTFNLRRKDPTKVQFF